MMFDEREVFKGLTAWFSSSVPSSSVSQWVKHGGLRASEVDNADYVFSSNPAAQDTLRIFDSQKYSNEQLTVFSTSLIEETVTSGKMYLSGKYTGAYILVHPDYQGEIDTFLGGKRPRYNESDNLRSTTIVNVRTGQNDIAGKEGSFTEAEHELVDKESCDEWEFKDESHLHVTNIRDAKRLDRKPVASNWNKGDIVLPSSLINSVPDPDHRSAFKPTTEKLSCGEESLANDSMSKSIVTLLPVEKERSICMERETDMATDLDENCSTTYASSSRQSSRTTDEIKLFTNSTDSQLMGLEDKGSFLEGTCLKNQLSSFSSAMAKSRFLSSMDDGVVHIDDIKLPVNQIDDFVPNCNGCRVFSK